MEDSDQKAVQAALQNPEAFSTIIDRYRYPLSRYIQRLGAFDTDTTKDLLQESFIKVYLNLNDYKPSLSFSSWIYRITHNEVMTYFRYMRNRAHAFASEDALTLFESIPDELDILAESDARLRSVHVAEALWQLKPEYRETLVLRFFEGKSYDEISDILEIAPGTVATHIARGKVALEKLLREMHITSV
ncbi:MAG: subfamily polymerase sigma factor [Parcubacteria group bacterium]|nr:subfamily polymerase sigma factor [Parcubacteria group bacterium]